MRILYTVIVVSILITGCKKYLDKKPDQTLAVPDNLEDLQLLLDNVNDINIGPASANAGSDEYYLNASDWDALDQYNREAYVWDPIAEADSDWSRYYKTIFTANTILENLEKVNRTQDEAKWDQIKGSALFVRGISLYQLAQVLSPYYSGKENSAYGLPLRLNPDFNEPVTRASLKETYDRLIADVQNSIPLLPRISQYKTQPSKWAAYALMARISLLMGDYQKAYDFSDSSLSISDELLNYNTIDESLEFPFVRFNPEVIYHTATDVPVNAFYWMARVDSVLYKSFAPEDRRKVVFFIDNGDGSFSFKGNYTGGIHLFTGLATDEVFLNKAEAAVRLGKVQEALDELNTLLASRYVQNEFEEITITAPEELLRLILQERKKQLMYRGTRWSDLRRLNTDVRFRETLNREINGEVYTLAPGDPRYLFLIPARSVNLSNIPQNPR